MSNIGVDESEKSANNSNDKDGSEKGNVGLMDMSVMEHLDELRKRIITSLVAIIVSLFVSFAFIDRIFTLIIHPYGPDFHPVVLDPTERFFSYFKISMATGLIIASPWVIFQIWMFIAPALLPREKRLILPVIPVILFLFVIGAAFGYFLVTPIALRFLLNFGNEIIENQIRLEKAVNFVVNICLISGLVFQLPVIVFLLSKAGLITAAFLRRKRKLSVLVIFILAAVITPTGDPFTLMLLVIPMWFLFEISIFVAGMARPARLGTSKEQDESEKANGESSEEKS